MAVGVGRDAEDLQANPVDDSLWGEQEKGSLKRVTKYYFLLSVYIFKTPHHAVTFISASPWETWELTLPTI